MCKVVLEVVAFLSLFCVATNSAQAGAAPLAADTNGPRTVELDVFTRQFDAVRQMSLVDLVMYTTQVLERRPTLSPHEKLCILGEFCSRLMPKGNRAGLLYLFAQISRCISDSTSSAKDAAAEQLFDAFIGLLNTVERRSSVECKGDGNDTFRQVIAFCKYVRAVNLLEREVRRACGEMVHDDANIKRSVDTQIAALRYGDVFTGEWLDGLQRGIRCGCDRHRLESLISHLDGVVSAAQMERLETRVRPFVTQAQDAMAEVNKVSPCNLDEDLVPSASFYWLDIAFGVESQEACLQLGSDSPVCVGRSCGVDSYWKTFWCHVGNVSRFGGKRIRLFDDWDKLTRDEAGQRCRLRVDTSLMGEVVSRIDRGLRPGFGAAFFGLDVDYAIEMPETHGGVGDYSCPEDADQGIASLLFQDTADTSPLYTLAALLSHGSCRADSVADSTEAWRARLDSGFDTSVLWGFSNILLSSTTTAEILCAVHKCGDWLVQYLSAYGTLWALQRPEVVVAFELLQAYCADKRDTLVGLSSRLLRGFHADLPTVMACMLKAGHTEFCEQLVRLLRVFPVPVFFPVGQSADQELTDLARSAGCVPLIEFLADAPVVARARYSAERGESSTYGVGPEVAAKYETAGGHPGLLRACSDRGQLARFLDGVFPDGLVGNEAAVLNLLSSALRAFTLRERPLADHEDLEYRPFEMVHSLLIHREDWPTASRAVDEAKYEQDYQKWHAAVARSREASVLHGGPGGQRSPLVPRPRDFANPPSPLPRDCAPPPSPSSRLWPSDEPVDMTQVPRCPPALAPGRTQDYLNYVFDYWFPETEAAAAEALPALSSLSDNSKRLLCAYFAFKGDRRGLQYVYSLMDESADARQYYLALFHEICRRFPAVPERLANAASDNWASETYSDCSPSYWSHLRAWFASFFPCYWRTPADVYMPELCNLLVGDVLMDGMQPIEVHYLGGRLRDFVYSLASIEPARRHLVCKLVFHQGVDFRNAGEYDMLRPVFPLLTSVFFLGRVISLPKDADYGEYSVHIGLFPTKRTEWIDCCGGNARWTCPPSNNNEMLLENLGIDFGKATKWADRRSCQISNCQTAENFVNSVNWGRILSGDGGIQVDPDLLELVRENLSVDPEPAFGTLLLKRLLVGGAMADISRTDVLCLPSFPFGTDDECFDRADPLYGADSFFGIDDPEPGVWRNDVVPWSVGHFSDTGAAIPISYADSVDALSFLAKFWPKANSSESLEKYAPDSFMKGLVRFLDVCPAVCGWSLDGTRQISWCDIAEQLYANSKLAWLSDAAGRIAAEYLCRCGRTSGVFFASPSSADFAAAVTSWTALNEVADPECLQDFVGPFGITVSGESGSESLAIKGSPVELDDRPFLVTVLVERPCWSMEVVGGDYVGVKALGLGALMKVILDVAPDFARDEFARRALFDLVLRNLGLNVIRQPEIVDTMSAYWSRVCGSLPLDTAN